MEPIITGVNATANRQPTNPKEKKRDKKKERRLSECKR